MERAGNEKKIRALFRELKLEDERAQPGFAGVWNRAQATSPRPRRAFKLSFAAATALLFITFCSVALWSRNWQRGQQFYASVASASPTPAATLSPPPTEFELKQPDKNGLRHRVRSNHWTRKLAARRQAELAARNAAIREAVALASWQSPTAMLMQSPADDVLTSLPQLNQSAVELKSFLPDTEK
jgi:hypothetical protein